jgi:hypothetical protein
MDPNAQQTDRPLAERANASAMSAVAVIFTILSTGVTILRVFARWRVIKSFSHDDTAVCLAQVLAIVVSIFGIPRKISSVSSSVRVVANYEPVQDILGRPAQHKHCLQKTTWKSSLR